MIVGGLLVVPVAVSVNIKMEGLIRREPQAGSRPVGNGKPAGLLVAAVFRGRREGEMLSRYLGTPDPQAGRKQAIRIVLPRAIAVVFQLLKARGQPELQARSGQRPIGRGNRQGIVRPELAVFQQIAQPGMASRPQ